MLAGIDPINNTISGTTHTEAPSPLTLLPPVRATYRILTGATLLPAPGLEEHIPEYILCNTSRLFSTYFNRGAQTLSWLKVQSYCYLSDTGQMHAGYTVKTADCQGMERIYTPNTTKTRCPNMQGYTDRMYRTGLLYIKSGF